MEFDLFRFFFAFNMNIKSISDLTNKLCCSHLISSSRLSMIYIPLIHVTIISLILFYFKTFVREFGKEFSNIFQSSTESYMILR